jgi:hypothetical protein
MSGQQIAETPDNLTDAGECIPTFRDGGNKTLVAKPGIGRLGSKQQPQPTQYPNRRNAEPGQKIPSSLPKIPHP